MGSLFGDSKGGGKAAGLTSANDMQMPLTPTYTRPIDINTPFGRAQAGSRSYNFSSPNSAQAGHNVSSAQQGFGGILDQLKDPTALAQHASDIYGNMMRPQFEQSANQYLGQTEAGLGNRYKSTYGQLTLDQASKNTGLARAQLEGDIYNQGQSYIDNLYNRGSTSANIASAAQNQQYAPYQLLAQLLQQGNQPFEDINKLKSQDFATKTSGKASKIQSQFGYAGKYNEANQSQLAPTIQALGTAAGAILPFI